jgi:hypothetical protein
LKEDDGGGGDDDDDDNDDDGDDDDDDDDDDKYILRYWNDISYSMRIFRQVGTSSADQIPF